MDFLERAAAEHDAIVERLTHELGSKMGPALLGRLCHLASAAGTSLDEEAAMLYVGRELRQEVHRALTGYRDWLALTLRRQGPASGGAVALPKPRPEDVARIVEEYDLDDEDSLGLVIAAVCARTTDLPVVGRISGGKVEPNYEAIGRWAERYDLVE